MASSWGFIGSFVLVSSCSISATTSTDSYQEIDAMQYDKL